MISTEQVKSSLGAKLPLLNAQALCGNNLPYLRILVVALL